VIFTTSFNNTTSKTSNVSFEDWKMKMLSELKSVFLWLAFELSCTLFSNLYNERSLRQSMYTLNTAWMFIIALISLLLICCLIWHSRIFNINCWCSRACWFHVTLTRIHVTACCQVQLCFNHFSHWYMQMFTYSSHSISQTCLICALLIHILVYNEWSLSLQWERH